MKAVDKNSGCMVEITEIHDNGIASVKSEEGIENFRKISELKLETDEIDLNDKVKVILTKAGAKVLNRRAKAKMWNAGDEYVDVMWKIMSDFKGYFRTDAEPVFKKLRKV